jgi:D-alanyl-D-alanine carboxypeptidase
MLMLMALPASSDEYKDLKRYLTKLVDKENFIGIVVLIDKPNNPLWLKHFGLANLENKITTNTNDLFRIASATKPFIATLVIKLAMAGKINLDAQLANYLDNTYLHDINNANSVTVRQLLSMQSGIYNYTDNLKYAAFVKKHPRHKWSPMEVLHFARNMPAAFEPGTISQYSNTNYILLGILIEKVTGKSLADALNDEIFQPLKLNNTYLEMQQAIPNPIVPGYVYKNGNFQNTSHINDGRGLADGGIVTNASDLNNFIRHLMTDEKFIPAKWRLQMLTFHPMHSEDKVEYGLGLIRYHIQDVEIIGHDGSDIGYQSWMIFLPKSKTSIIFLSNNNPPRLDNKKFIKSL